MRPNSYKLAKCCGTCKYKFNITHLEDGTSDSFCHHDNSKRPLHPGEMISKDDKVFIKQLKKWDKWSIPRQVEECGVCHLYQMNEDWE
jgi:hypothetical protein